MCWLYINDYMVWIIRILCLMEILVIEAGVHSRNVQLLTKKHTDKKQKTFMRIDEIILILIEPLASINWL